MAKILSIVDTAYRGILEEQDDAGLWFSAACKNSGADLTLLLTGNAVNYAVKTQEPKPMSFGDAKIAHPPKLHEDLTRMIGKGVGVYMVKEDAAERGIDPGSCISGVEAIERKSLPKFIANYEMVWHW